MCCAHSYKNITQILNDISFLSPRWSSPPFSFLWITDFHAQQYIWGAVVSWQEVATNYTTHTLNMCHIMPHFPRAVNSTNPSLLWTRQRWLLKNNKLTGTQQTSSGIYFTTNEAKHGGFCWALLFSCQAPIINKFLNAYLHTLKE